MGHLRRNEAVGAVSGVPPIASEICALHDGSIGHNPPLALQNTNVERSSFDTRKISVICR